MDLFAPYACVTCLVLVNEKEEKHGKTEPPRVVVERQDGRDDLALGAEPPGLDGARTGTHDVALHLLDVEGDAGVGQAEPPDVILDTSIKHKAQ